MPAGPGQLSHEELEAEVERLWHREAFFDASQRLAQFGYCEWDYDNGRIISCTNAYAEIFGMTIEEVTASQSSWQKVIEQIHPDDREHYAESYRLPLGKGSHEVEYRIFRKDGEVRHIKEVAIVVKEKDGNRKQAVGLIQDVTEHVDMRREIEASAAKLKLAARTARLGYWHFDEVANLYLDISEEYAEIFGYSVDEFLEHFRSLDDDMQLVHPDDQEALYEAYDTGYGKVDYDYRIRHRDGSWRHVREISVDIKDKDGNFIEAIGTLQDITELREAQLRAERANQAKNEFLSRMSHELRTPLNAILGFSQLIEADQSLDRRQQSKATAIFRAGQHLLSLIDEVLDLTRLEAGNIEVPLEPVSLEAVVRDSLDLVSDIAENRGITIDCDLANCQGLMVEANATRLRQVFLNLLSNAVKYNHADGRVWISSTLDRRGLVNISVADTGPGISSDRIGDLFEPFNRLGAESSEIEGTGIGLVITRQLVELMQGELEVESHPGAGSTFSVRLRSIPARVSGPATVDEAPGVEGPAQAGVEVTRPRILVAEDNLVNQALIAEQLEYLGYRADFAENGVDALALWRSGTYPLLITDIRMPGMNGNELISQIRAADSDDSNRPIIAITASAMDSDLRQCFDSGASDVVSKPLVLDTLKKVMHKWMPGQVAGGDPRQAAAQVEPDAFAEAIDLSVLRQSVGAKVEVQQRLLKTYIDALPRALFDIRQAYAWHNLEQLGGLAHKLKSSSSSLGATGISQLCNTLELACCELSDADIAIILAQLQQAAESVIAFVEAFCEEVIDSGEAR
ncbi:MAG: PAS domain-containing protein [Gammaproteobacteria bacterium]|nr:PAS domain-containing protein [Gammaproteobacteria bacterium]MDH3449610.1 PAS domain-containing protein [Gammaproteobacteria bacterium]